MFNSYSSVSNMNIKVNAVSGTAVKNFKESFFIRCEAGTTRLNELFSSEPMAYDGNRYRPAVVIQSMIIGDGVMLVEVMWKEDFDKMFEVQNREE